MSNINWSEIEFYGLDHLSNQEILDGLPPVTFRIVKVSDLRRLFRDESLLYEWRNSWSGPLMDAAESMGVDSALGRFCRHVCNDVSTDFDLTNSVIASDFANGCPPLIAFGLFTDELVNNIYRLGGGLKFSNISLENIEEAKQENIMSELSQSINSLFDEARNAAVLAVGNGADRAAALAAGQAVIDADGEV